MSSWNVFRTMELSAKFETVIDRYQFMNIPNGGADANKKFLELCAEVVVTIAAI